MPPFAAARYAPQLRPTSCKVSARIYWQKRAAEQKLPEKLAAYDRSSKMRKTLVAMLCSALMAASSQVATAAQPQAEHHHAGKASLKPAMANEQFGNSSNELPSDATTYSLCGNLPGPCQ
jgi:hypothetical protein